ncbi:DICT sensory domain-containing protein [Nocardioides sp. Bht2]|uniref:DICT sensory domain-containing protein n=1 Tax=Nocardioides sp. Bht2 TaxID=3392297 RepID=UPI0039B6B920
MDEFSVGELAERTGLTPGVLRTWENRHGFPEGRRKGSGHRRFTERDVEDVRQVLEARAAGVPLRLAIDTVRSQRGQLDSPSLFAQLTASFPYLQPRRLSRKVLVALSHAIEDESLGRGGAALALGAFQTGDRFGESAQRWHELARTALWAAVVGEFEAESDAASAGPGAGGPPGAPVLVQLPPGAPMRREWSVVCLSPEFAVVLAAWEVPATGARDYEAFISTDREVVIAAARNLAGVVEAAGTPVPEAARKLLAETTIARAGTSALDTERLLLRAMSYLS